MKRFKTITISYNLYSQFGTIDLDVGFAEGVRIDNLLIFKFAKKMSIGWYLISPLASFQSITRLVIMGNSFSSRLSGFVCSAFDLFVLIKPTSFCEVLFYPWKFTLLFSICILGIAVGIALVLLIVSVTTITGFGWLWGKKYIEKWERNLQDI
jgi:hypothetical protein